MGDAAAATQATLPYVVGSDTSKAAATLFRGEAKTARERVFYAISRVRSGGGLTDEELQNSLVMNPSTQRPRRGELVDAGLVHDTGRRRKTSTGAEAVVWGATGRPYPDRWGPREAPPVHIECPLSQEQLKASHGELQELYRYWRENGGHQLANVEMIGHWLKQVGE